MRKVTTTTELFSYAELTYDAQEQARELFYQLDEGELGQESAECFLDTIRDAGKLLGIDIDGDIYWDAGRSTVSIAANYEGVKDAAKAVIAEFPGDAELVSIATRLDLAQSGLSGEGTATLRQDSEETVVDAEDSDIEQALSDFIHWAGKGISEAHDFPYSLEQIIEHFECNECEFEADGTLA